MSTPTNPSKPFCEFQCPKCGRWGDDGSLVRRTQPEFNYAKSMEFGGNPLDWVEYHKCPNCDTAFEFENSNC